MLGEVIGMAASLCAKEGIEPRELSGGRFEKLRAMLEKGVPVPTYHAYGCDDSESYHFKEIGFVSVKPTPANARQFDHAALKRRVLALGVQHKYRHPGL